MTQNLTQKFRHLPLLSAALALFCGLLSSPAQAQNYQVKSLSEGGAYALAMNATGQVTGSAPDGVGGYQAFLSGPDGQGIRGITSFSIEASGNALNAWGQIGGDVLLSSSPRITQAFLSGPNGQGATLLGGLGGNFSSVRAIANTGTAVGVARDTANNLLAVKWLPGSTAALELGTLGGPTSMAWGINESGLIAGVAALSDGSRHAVVWGLNGATITDLGTLGGSRSGALAINGVGQVVGSASLADGSTHAFITGVGAQGMSDLGTLGWTHSQAALINSAGMVAGNLFNGTDTTSYQAGHGFITGANGQGMVDLNSLVSLGQDLYVNDVWGLNDAGQLLVSDQNGWSYLLTPVPETASWALLLAGLLMLSLRARQRHEV